MKLKHLSLAIICSILFFSMVFFDKLLMLYKKYFVTPETLEQKLLNDPDNSEINYQIGLLKYKKGQYASAANFFDKAATSFLQNLKSKALANSGNCKYRLAERIINPPKNAKKKVSRFLRIVV